jgi:lambda family phage portal protein
MNTFQRIKARFDAWRARRATDKARPLAMLGYEGATQGRRGKNWRASSLAPDDLAFASLQALRDRSRHMVRNHWAAARAVDVLATHIVGAGIIPTCRDSEAYGEFLRELARPKAQIGTLKGQSLGAVQRMIARTVIESGSAIVVRQWRTAKQRRDRNLPLPFQIGVLEPEYLDKGKDGARDNGNQVVGGIEYDSTDWPVAYWLHTEHPGSNIRASSTPSRRVPSKDVAHVFWQKRAGQTIGVPWFHAVLVKMRDFDDFEDAHLLRQKIAALFVAFVRNMNSTAAPTSTQDIELEPGRIQWLNQGEEVEFASPPDVAGFGDYTHVTLRSIAAGIGLSYEDLSADYSRVNFSSARMGSIVGRQLTTVWQEQMMIACACAAIEDWIADGAVLSGLQPAPVKWIPPARELIDPSREVGAIERAIASGLTSRQHEIGKLGRDVRDVDAERVADAEREAELGLNATDPGEFAPGGEPDNPEESAAAYTWQFDTRPLQ